jgi:hypothetical protein
LKGSNLIPAGLRRDLVVHGFVKGAGSFPGRLRRDSRAHASVGGVVPPLCRVGTGFDRCRFHDGLVGVAGDLEPCTPRFIQQGIAGRRSEPRWIDFGHPATIRERGVCQGTAKPDLGVNALTSDRGHFDQSILSTLAIHVLPGSGGRHETGEQGERGEVGSHDDSPQTPEPSRSVAPALDTPRPKGSLGSEARPRKRNCRSERIGASDRADRAREAGTLPA